MPARVAGPVQVTRQHPRRVPLRSATLHETAKCENCHSRHGETGWPRRWRASFGSGEPVATGRLFLWPAARGEWVSCLPAEITWLDPTILSGDERLTIHLHPP